VSFPDGKKNESQRIVPLIEHVENMREEVESSDFCCFLTHRNLLPAAFLRTVVFYDAWDLLLRKQDIRIPEPLRAEIEIARWPETTVLSQCVNFFGTENVDIVRRPLVVKFVDEVAEGPGVNREYLQLALSTLVRTDVFEYTDSSHCYFFRKRTEPLTPEEAKICLAFGRLLAHIVLNKVNFVASDAAHAFEHRQGESCVEETKAFPTVFFKKLCAGLHDAVPLYRICDLEEYDPQAAASLRVLLKHEGDVSDWGIEGLRNDNREEYVRKFLISRFEEDVSEPYREMQNGFRSILGESIVLQALNSDQLKSILCGGQEDVVDMLALKQSAKCEGFDHNGAYLDEFWSLLTLWEEPLKRKFVRFVTAGDRPPLKGWCDLQLNIHKNGTEPTERLPTAYTCYNMLLLPEYEGRAKLESRLLVAITMAEGFGLQ